MKKQHIYQEVLVSTRTALAKKLLFETINNNRNASSAEKFEEECWTSFLSEMFSELMLPDSRKAEVSIMGAYKGRSYFLLELADVPHAIDSALSLNPHLFSCKVNMN